MTIVGKDEIHSQASAKSEFAIVALLGRRFRKGLSRCKSGKVAVVEKSTGFYRWDVRSTGPKTDRLGRLKFFKIYYRTYCTAGMVLRGCQVFARIQETLLELVVEWEIQNQPD